MKTAPKPHPPQHISASELRQNLGQVLQDVEEGESFVVERHGEPVATLSAPPPAGVRYGSTKPMKIPAEEFERFLETLDKIRRGEL